ncbi:MAG: HRDC domain-containing protein [Chloroflexi bacterium]|nr:HRDC domain-containing protein [Chloroflexota bacterium]
MTSVIDNEKRLVEMLPRLRSSDWIALDTEADSLHAYPEKVCLVQVSLEGADELIDPLRLRDLASFWAALRGRELILHGADYDLRLLRRGFRFAPDRVFDTMLAARLLGYTQFGLTHLVARHLGITLEKGPQTMNWARRPLTDRMIAYARNDTRYLKPLAELLQAGLQEKGRLDWQRESCQRLIAECAQVREPDPETVWRVKGSDRLDRNALAVLRELWRWREREAVKASKPPYFILSHETLVALAVAASKSEPLEPLLPRFLSSQRRSHLLAAVARGLAVPADKKPHLPRRIHYRPSDAERNRFDELKKRRDRRAAELEIDPTLIASRATLLALAQDKRTAEDELMSWQRNLLQ